MTCMITIINPVVFMNMKKKSCFVILSIFTFVLLYSGCTTVKQGKKPAEQKSVEKERKLSANYYFLKARIHIQHKEYEKAVVSLEKARSDDPDSFVITRDLVRLYLKLNNDEKAVKLAEELIQNNPDNVKGLLLLVQLKKDFMDEKKLVEILNRILVLDPENKETFLRLARIYLEKKNNSKALIVLKKMVDRFPNYYVARFYLGQAYLKNKAYEPAKKQFLKTIELEPEIVEPKFQLIKIYKKNNNLGNQKKIIKTYNQILKLEPDNHRAKMGMALYYFKNRMKEKARQLFYELGRDFETDTSLAATAADEYLTPEKYKDAVIIFSQMLKADPENSDLNFFMGLALEAIEDFEKAVFHYLKVVPSHSQYKKTALNIAFLYKKLGKRQKAVTFLENKNKFFPKDIDFIVYLASFYEDDQNYDKAITLLKKGLKESAENTSLLFRLGSVQDKAGFKEECISTMKKVIKIDPENAGALNYLGYSYADLGIKLDEALLLIKKAYEIKPEDGYITDSLGWIYFKMGNYKKAVHYLEKAARLTSYETIIADHLGDAYQKTNQFEKALNAYQKAISSAGKDEKERVLEIKKKLHLVQKKLNE